MNWLPKLALADGWKQSLGALVLAAAAAAMVAVPTWSRSQTTARLAILGVVLFAIALTLGSGRLVGLTTLPILGAALISVVNADQPVWVRGLAVGVLWYLAAELGWDAIERRDGVTRTAAYDNRRIDETGTVVLLSLAVTIVAFLVSSSSPVRTIVVVGIALVALAATLGVATQRLRRHADDAPNQSLET